MALSSERKLSREHAALPCGFSLDTKDDSASCVMADWYESIIMLFLPESRCGPGIYFTEL